jgi:hypothetical protein
MSGLPVSAQTMVMGTLQARNITTALVAVALVLAIILLVQRLGADAGPAPKTVTDNGLSAAHLATQARLPPAVTGAATMPVDENAGELLTREQYEADLRALQTQP